MTPMWRWVAYWFTRMRGERSERRVVPDREAWSAVEWARVRAPERHRDRELSPRARRWLERLPETSRPNELPVTYPRIVNQLAACWRDAGLTDHLLCELLADHRRGRRRGFPPKIIGELELLYECHDARLHLTPRREEPLASSRT
jgi:hypothetical protein